MCILFFNIELLTSNKHKMIIFIIKEIALSLVIIGLMTTVGIILYPWTEFVVSSLRSLYYSKRYSTKVTHSNYVHFNNSPLYHREYEKNSTYSSQEQYYWPVGDCAIRAVSCLLNKSWKQTFKLFSNYCCKLNYLSDACCVSDDLLDDYGYERIEIGYDWYEFGIPVHKFIKKSQFINKDVIIQCKKVGSDSYHLVCCKKGKYYDAYDSGNFIVLAVYVSK